MPGLHMPKLDALLKEIGATDSSTWKPEDDKPRYTLRPLTEEELADYNAKKAEKITVKQEEGMRQKES